MIENNVATEQSFEEAIVTLKEANDDVNSRIRNNYKSMIKYYKKVGDGAISKYAGVIVSEKLINIFTQRYLELGGSFPDLNEE